MSVRGSHVRDFSAGHDEGRAAVAGGQHDRVADVNPTGQLERPLPLPAEPARNRVEPRPRGVHHHASAHDQRLAGRAVDDAESDSARLVFAARDLGVVGDESPLPGSRDQRLEREPRIVGGVFGERDCTREAVTAERRLGGHGLGAVEAAVRAFSFGAGKACERPEAGAHLQPAAQRADRDQHRRRACQVRRETAKDGPFTRRLADQADIPLGEVTDAAVNEFRRTTAGTAGEIPPLEQHDRQAVENRLAGDAGTGDPTPHDSHVEDVFGRTRKHLAAPRRGKAIRRHRPTRVLVAASAVNGHRPPVG